jgi:uncharacterized membrane protein
MKKLIALLALTASVSTMAGDLSCGGTEPFWGLEIKGEKVIFSNPYMESVTTEKVTLKQEAANTNSDFAFVLTTESGATATVITGECNDGMSDTIYSKHIIYKNAEDVLYGCCNEIK